ncbi:Cysteine proteinase inhibitor 5 [Bienertia sinuspersici]
MRTQQVYFLFSLLLITITSAAGGLTPAKSQPLPGGYTPINNISDPHVIEVARFAVEEHNKQDDAHLLKFLRILKGWSQVVAGINYRLIIAAEPINCNGKVYHYEAIVYERPWQHFMNLTSFELIK